MALLLDQLLLTKDDFKTFRDISANITAEKVDAYIREAQTVECRGFLGQALWFRMQDNFDGTIFPDAALEALWFGKNYTNKKGEAVRFNGYMNAAVYFAYNRFINQQQANVSRFGVESIQNEISEDISNPQIRSKSKDALQVAFSYQNDAQAFLIDQQTDYPEWVQAQDKSARKTSTSFFVLK